MRSLYAIAALALCAAGCGSSSDNGGTTGPVCTTPPPEFVSTIVVTDFQFSPACAKVHASTAITFQNDGATTHTATDAGAIPPTFDTPDILAGSSATLTFPAPATLQVFCRFHPTMRATIFVE